MAMSVDWRGVWPALMTEFKDDESLDLDATAAHIEATLQAGVSGLVMLGTLGENCSLTADEKRDVVRCAVETVGGRVPVISGVSEFTTPTAARYVQDIGKLGAAGAMVLPPMVYKTDRAETIAHFSTVAEASDIPLMVYNNPVTYGTDTSPEMFAELARYDTLVAIKESSDDVRRITDLINEVGDRYTLFCGVDDIVVESVMLGADGWVAGLVNSFPAEAVRMYDLAASGDMAAAREIYRWFMPMLHLDCHSKLVQYIKLANRMTGLGSEMVRAPRLKLAGAERDRIAAIIQKGIDTRPQLTAMAAE